MSLYESIFLARPDLSKADVEKLAEQFRNIITEFGGKVLATEHWGLRNLAYNMGKIRKAYYVMFNIESSYEAISEMERKMKINEDIVRFLTLRVENFGDTSSLLAESEKATEEVES